MSVGPTNLAGSLAGTPLAQTRQDGDRSTQQATDQTRARQSDAQATAAAGIGETSAEHEAADRDADGRRLWEEPPPAPDADPSAGPSDTLPPPDPHGERGTQLDLQG